MRSSTKRMLVPLAVCEGAGRPTGVAQDDPSRICCNTDGNLTRTSQVNSIGRLCCLTDKLSTIHSPTGPNIFFPQTNNDRATHRFMPLRQNHAQDPRPSPIGQPMLLYQLPKVTRVRRGFVRDLCRRRKLSQPTPPSHPKP